MPYDPTFWDRIAERYSKRPVSDEAAYARWLDKVRGLLTPDAEVLEIGCGTGTTALKLADTGARITATDFSPKMIEIARAKPQAPNVAFKVATVDDPAFAPESFDAVMAYSLLHLVDDLPGTLARARALLKPGGLLISKTVCIGEAGLHIRLLLPLMRLVGFAPPVALLKPADIDAAITAAGFEIVAAEAFPGMAPSHFVIARAPL